MNTILQRSRWVAGSLLAAGCLLGVPLAGTVHAGYTTCTSDPVVLLSNGLQVTTKVSISDTMSGVKGVTYALHVPNGVRATKITYTGGGFAGKETLTVVADEPTSTYLTATTVTTGMAKVSVTAQTTVQIASATGTGPTSKPSSGSASGTSGQTLTISLTHS